MLFVSYHSLNPTANSCRELEEEDKKVSSNYESQRKLHAEFVRALFYVVGSTVITTTVQRNKNKKH